MVRNDLNRQGGFTLIESIISFSILVIIIMAVVELFGYDLASISTAKTRALGLALANQQVEYLRDLPYNSLATVSGPIYPPGGLLDDQFQTSGNIKFRIHTLIDYVDDPYDGNATGTIVGKPVDLYPYDYKQAQVSVYLASTGKRVASLTTAIAAKAAETSSNTGILIIKVLNANGQPVAGANIHVTNTNPNPDVDISTTTDNNGLVVIPKLPPDNAHGYHIVASKGGYSTDTTNPDPVGSQSPTNPDPNILVQQITNITLAIDQLASLSLHVIDTSGNPIASQSVITTGAKTLDVNPSVYKYSTTQTTDSQGNITLSNIEWDSYSFALPAGKYIVTVAPVQPVALAPNSTQNLTITVSPSSTWPRISTINPTTDATGTNPVTLTITGSNLSGATFKLHLTGQSDITATSLSSTATTLSGKLNLTGATTGNWDIIVTGSGGNQAIQTGGYSVTP